MLTNLIDATKYFIETQRIFQHEKQKDTYRSDKMIDNIMKFHKLPQEYDNKGNTPLMLVCESKNIDLSSFYFFHQNARI